MKIIIFVLFILFTVNLNATDYLLSKSDIQLIKKSPDKKFIVNRYKSFIQLKKILPSLNNEYKVLLRVNNFFNKFRSQSDLETYGTREYWASRKEFLIKGKGDCEDYALAKYFTLIEAGIPKEKLSISIAKVKNNSDYHIVVLYKNNKESQSFVLDNINYKIKSLSSRKDLTTFYTYNSDIKQIENIYTSTIRKHK